MTALHITAMAISQRRDDRPVAAEFAMVKRSLLSA
jgi:hypothetical protein